MSHVILLLWSWLDAGYTSFPDTTGDTSQHRAGSGDLVEVLWESAGRVLQDESQAEFQGHGQALLIQPRVIIVVKFEAQCEDQNILERVLKVGQLCARTTIAPARQYLQQSKNMGGLLGKVTHRHLDIRVRRN